MIILTQTTTGTPVYKLFSTKRTTVPKVIVKTLNEAEEFCTCITQCIPDLKVFTDEVGTDYYKNDFTSFFMTVINAIGLSGSTVSRKIVNVDTGVETALVDSTHGDYYAGNYYVWFKVDWFKIYSTLGYGKYKIVFSETSISSGQQLNQLTSQTYHLQKYTDKEAQKTIRIESSQSGKLHHGNDYSNLTTASITEPFPFLQQTRLPGSLIYKSNEDESDHLVLNNSERSTLQVKDQVRPMYDLNIYLVGAQQVSPVIFDQLFGNEVTVTDYNVFNPCFDPRDLTAIKYKSIPLRRESSSFNVKRTHLKTSFTFSMVYEYDNIFKTNN